MTRQLSAKGRFVPRLEVLEERRLLACKVVEAGGVLTITGDARANVVQIQDDGTKLTVTCDGKSTDVSADVTKVVVNTRQGNDRVSYQLTGDLASGAARTLVVDLGNGNDRFDGTLGGNLAAGASLGVTVRGGNGKDIINFTGDAAGVAAGASLAL